MVSEKIEIRKVKNVRDWLNILILYRLSFPKSERKPFHIILRMHKKGRTDVLCAFLNGKFGGFAATINGDGGILLDYLAVRKNMRNRGLGSAILTYMFRFYSGKGVFVEIENAFRGEEHAEERLRRRSFYIRNDMQPMNVFASVFGVQMELLGHGMRIDFERYRAFYGENYSEFAAKHILPSSKNE